jgi:hypothetical protein
MPDVLNHFSEDPSITRFEPHVAATAVNPEPLVWAIDDEHADLYFFPRDCPRVTFYASPTTSAVDRERFLGASAARRVAAIEAAWLEPMDTIRLHRYYLPGDGFELRDATAGYWVSRRAVEPLRVEPMGDLAQALADANVELRILESLWPLYEEVVASTLGFSINRWHNAAPRPPAAVALAWGVRRAPSFSRGARAP